MIAEPAPAALLDADRSTFARSFDREPFSFKHNLADNPLFAPDELLALAQSMAGDPRDVYYDAGDPEIGARWDQVPVCDLPISELLHRIETANAWIVLRKAEKDPRYAALLEGCFAEIEALSGRNLRPVLKLKNAIIFINSPYRVSTYHIDRECNFLLQVRGTKTVSIFDRSDREVLPEDEIERFWAVDNNAAVYKPAFADRATAFELAPGHGVHIPVNSPHWVRNGPDVSVSLSVNFHYHDGVLADLYRANYWLRKAGLRPKPPLHSPRIDGVKRALYGSSRFVRRAARRFGGSSE